MNERTEAIRKKLQEMFSGEDQVFLATVKEVDENEFTCTVLIDDELEYTDVRLRSVIDQQKQGFAFVPKVGSMVLVGRIGNSDQLFVALFSEVNKVLMTAGSLEVTVDPEKVEVKKGSSTFRQTEAGFTFTRSNEGLKKLLQDLITEITQLTVPTGVGPSGMPINAAAFTAIKTRVGNLMEG